MVIILLLAIIGSYVMTTVLVVQNAQSSASQFSTLTENLQQTNENLQQTQQELLRAESELNELKMETSPNVTLVQNGTLWMFLGNNGVLNFASPFATSMSQVQTTYSFYQVSLAGGATMFNVLQIDPPETPLVVSQSITSQSSGYYYFVITMQSLDPPLQQFTTFATDWREYWYPLSNVNADQLSIFPDCVSSGNCVQTASNSHGTLAYDSFTPSMSQLNDPAGGMFYLFYMSTTNSPSYNFTNSQWTLTGPLKLILTAL